MTRLRSLTAMLAGMLLCLPLLASAQYPPPGTPPPQPYAQSPGQPYTQPPQQAMQPPAQPLSQDQLDALLAPIALYPDELLTQVLMASTYPLEVVEAARFVKANPTLKGPALDDALRDKTWDPSVLSLVPFPQVLDMMNDKLEWTQRLGDAFLADESAVMQTVQMLRQRAEQAGNLQSNAQQRVYAEDRHIVIEPAQPEYVYVPVYNPLLVYGPWWAPAYRPWYWYPPPIWGYPPAPLWWGSTAGFFWGSGWAVHRSYWGWAHPNWRSNSVNINVNNHYWASRPQYRDRYPNGTGNWTHAPEHRKGVAYRDAATFNKYRPVNPTAVQSRESYRGNPARSTTFPATGAGSPVNRPAPIAPGVAQPATRPAGPAFAQPTAPLSSPRTQSSVRPATPPLAQPIQPVPGGAPTFQTRPRPQVQMESSRGQASRQQMYQPPPPNRAQPIQPQSSNRAQPIQPQSSNRAQPNQPQANQPRQGSPGGGDSPQGRSR